MDERKEMKRDKEANSNETAEKKNGRDEKSEKEKKEQNAEEKDQKEKDRREKEKKEEDKKRDKKLKQQLEEDLPPTFCGGPSRWPAVRHYCLVFFHLVLPSLVS